MWDLVRFEVTPSNDNLSVSWGGSEKNQTGVITMQEQNESHMEQVSPGFV